MAKRSVFLHPILSNPRSRMILFIFAGMAAVFGVLTSVYTDYLLKKNGVVIEMDLMNRHKALMFFMSTGFQIFLTLITASIGAALTSKHVIGPVKRIEQWLLDMEAGHDMVPLKLREGDKFEKLCDLINKLHKRIKNRS